MVLCVWVVSFLVAWIHTGPAVHMHLHTCHSPPHVPLAQARPRPSPRKGVQLLRPAPPRLTKRVHLVRGVDPSPPFLPRSKGVQLRTWVWMEVIHNVRIGNSCATTCRKARESAAAAMQGACMKLRGTQKTKTRVQNRRGAVRVRAAASLGGGTPVRETSLLVVGATGTLGRQVVRRALDEGYDVRCLVRPRYTPADFLRDWGATTVRGDLTDPSSLPAALVGVHTIVDAATSRPEEPITKVDWEGKVALIQCAQAMGIQRYVFYSIHGCERHPEVPLMNIKKCTEEYLESSGLDYTVFRLCGFMQAIIQNYAVPILEEKTVWGTDDQTRTAYMDTQDIARLTMAAVRSENCSGKTMTLAGPRAFTVPEVIALCERFAGADANVSKVPVSVLRLARSVLNFFQWSGDAADRLAFAEVLTANEVFSASMEETYKLLGCDPSDTTLLEKYLQDYYTRILKKLKDVGGQSRQGDFYL